MANCVNCSNQALYVNKVTPNPRTDTYYCPKHLPRFLFAQAKAGLLNIPVEVVPDPVEVPKKKKEKVETVIETTAAPETDIVE